MLTTHCFLFHSRRFKDPEPRKFLSGFFLTARDFRRRKTRELADPVPAATAATLSRRTDIPIDVTAPPEDEPTSSSDTSTSSSPIMSYAHLAQDPSQPGTPISHGARALHAAPSDTGSNALGLSPEMGRSDFGLKAASANSSSSSLASMRRERAGSVGVDGPLVELDETALSGEPTDIDGSSTDGSPKRGAGLRRRTTGARKALPKGGPAFGFTEVKS